MPVSLSAIRNELLPGLASVEGKYKEYPTEYSKIFTTRKSKMNFERTTSMRFLGLAALKTEGGAYTHDDNSGERFLYQVQHIEVGLGYAVTRLAIEDNLYKAQFEPSNLGLQKSFRQTKEIYAANVLNTATTYNTSLGGDGVALLSTAHPVDGTVIANTPTVQVDLSESSLLQAQVNIGANFRDNAGLLNQTMAELLIIPPALEPVANRLLKTELRPGTGDNDINVIPLTAGGIKKGYMVSHYLTSPYSWYLRTDVEGLINYERMPFEMSTFVDDTTDNLIVRGRERYSFTYTDWRSLYGSTPTS